jgi:hypothetical protein
MECSVLPSTGMHSCRPAYHHVVTVVQQHSPYLLLTNHLCNLWWPLNVVARCLVACDQVCGVHVHEVIGSVPPLILCQFAKHR